ncbi:ABC transporter substrate-binding protein [Bradyrhizobium tropiciagri]|uniref:ABC transporter substrate-binding protein n=1 Tax=Bradyrhizobium tropiciagri TaxID=312253 RepID=UPI00067CABFC|nr:ABC transporter substrate-binding protein [Bradyrhizobium tropiciagri]
MFYRVLLFALVLSGAGASVAEAEVKIGVILSLTGSSASLGIPARNTVDLWPKEIGGQAVQVTILDDASDPGAATTAARKLTAENAVDVIVGPSITPTSLAIMQVAEETGTPALTLAGSSAIVDPPTGPRRWMFKLPPNEAIALHRILGNMQQNQKTKLGVVAVSNAYGQTFLDVASKIAAMYNVSIIATERFNPTDPSFASQALKIVAARPDAVFIAATGTPGATPQIELKRRGFAGTIYQTQAIANADFLRVGGKDVEGTLFPVAPLLVAEQLPDTNPIKKVALEYLKAYERKYGEKSRSLFGGVAWDAQLIIQAAIKQALGKAAPGTREFRQALRDSIEQLRDLVVTHGVYSFSTIDHNGADERSQVMVEIRDGNWLYVEKE